jgi:UDP-N-acetylglucosamine 2-epimerase (non-hydrolysing)/GDP/UDP-N,N'-diacetylbacillosamine 2-epimerase (hydrolysing)
LQPLIDRLEAHPDFELDLFSLDPAADFNVNRSLAYIHLVDERPDAVIVPCDRFESLAGALGAFSVGIPLIHFHAGDTGTVSRDEVYRHIISLLADVHLCNGPTARETVCDLLEAVGRTTLHVYDVGSTAMDDVEIDVSRVPGCHPYDLVLYHPPTYDPELINRELDEIEILLDPGVHVKWCYPNRDPGSDIIVKRINSLDVDSYTELPRPQFLGLMKHCSRYIGNSSSMIYEAPMWLREDQIIHIGNRNRNRSYDEMRPGGTDQIIKVLGEIDWSEDLKTGNHQK